MKTLIDSGRKNTHLLRMKSASIDVPRTAWNPFRIASAGRDIKVGGNCGMHARFKIDAAGKSGLRVISILLGKDKSVILKRVTISCYILILSVKTSFLYKKVSFLFW